MATHIAREEYSDALKVVNDKDFYNKKNHKLLRYLELGTVNYLNKNYCQALYYFNRAEKTAEELYTVSLSSKFKSFVLGGESDEYYGSNVDKSLIYFYKSLINYKVSLLGKCEQYSEEQDDGKLTTISEKTEMTSLEKLEYLQKARSNIMKWDSVLNSFKNESGNKDIYKNDLLEKIWGSFIFKENGGINDLTRAEAMLKSAISTFNSDYMLYPSFNRKYTDFNSHYSKQISKNLYIDYTNRANEILLNINNLKNTIKKNDSNNLAIVVSESVISPLRSIVISLPFPMHRFSDDGMRSFASMAFEFRNGQYYFKVPLAVMSQELYGNELFAEIYDSNNNLVKKIKVNLIEPLSEMVYKEYKKYESSSHNSAISASENAYFLAVEGAYSIYKNGGDKSKTAGTFALWAAIALIDTTGAGLDLRTWRSLPATIRFANSKLPVGKYKLVLKNTGTISTIPSSAEITYFNSQAIVKTMNNTTVYETKFKIEDGKTTLLDMRIDPTNEKGLVNNTAQVTTEIK